MRDIVFTHMSHLGVSAVNTAYSAMKREMPMDLADLKESNDFLNLLLENISSAVLIVDSGLRVRQFNGALKKIFGREPEKIAGQTCGEALGCIFAELEGAVCGKSTHCNKCRLRQSIENTRRKKVPGRQKILARKFFSGTGPVQKYLEYSTVYLQFDGRELALVIMDDITERYLQRRELVRRQRQIDLDLQAAASIQKTLLPSPGLVCDHIEACWEFLPSSTIGGDLFNLLSLEGGRTGCYIMDASGHGVHSALVAVSVSQLLQPASSRLPLSSPRAVCSELDGLFPLQRFNTFFSMIYMVLDPRAGTVSWCNAGHPPAMLLRSGGEIELLGGGGPIIGLSGLLPYTGGSKQIEPGDRIFLYTDGLIERRNRKGAFFGIEGVAAILAGGRKQPLSASISALVRAASEFGEGLALADDMSLLGLEIKREAF